MAEISPDAHAVMPPSESSPRMRNQRLTFQVNKPQLSRISCEEDAVRLQAAWFKTLGPRNRGLSRRLPQNRPAIRITLDTGAETVTIYRRLIAATAPGFTKDHMVLSEATLNTLDVRANEQVALVLRKSWWLPFFWNHPTTAVRLPFKVGVALAVFFGLPSWLSLAPGFL